MEFTSKVSFVKSLIQFFWFCQRNFLEIIFIFPPNFPVSGLDESDVLVVDCDLFKWQLVRGAIDDIP